MNRGILFVMSGPSGTGKGTICEQLLRTEDIYLSVSSTTREKRKGETEGVTYNYISLEEFKKLIDDDEMLEYAQYSGNYYGTPRHAVETMLEDGKNVLLEIEPQGALKVKNKFPEAVLMFIVPPSMEELKRRLIERGRETEEQIEERLNAARWEFEQSPKYNNIFINDDLDSCVNKIAESIKKKSEEKEFIERLLKENY